MNKKLKGAKIKLSYSNVEQNIILHTFEQGTISISPPHIQTRQDSSMFSPPHISIPKKNIISAWKGW